MTEPALIPCLVTLRDEFNQDFPHRRLASDGWIGDTAHQHEVSDHNPDETGNVPIHDADHINEVHAIDVDSNLVPYLQHDYMEDVVQTLLARCRSGAETRLRYIIYRRRIWQAKNKWRQEVYTGPSPHTEHAHFSASYDSLLEANRAPWHLKEDNMELSNADINRIADAVWAKQFDRVNPQADQGKQVSAGALLQFSEQNLKDATNTIVAAVAKTAPKS